MLKVTIKRPSHDEIHELFCTTIPHTWKKEGVGDEITSIKEEISEKKSFLEEDINSNGVKRFFLIACIENKIVGTIAYGPCSSLLIECSDGKYKDLGEIGTVFILPEYQKKGIGTLLLNAMFTALYGQNIQEFVLDSGYSQAQKVWTKKFGEPTTTALEPVVM